MKSTKDLSRYQSLIREYGVFSIFPSAAEKDMELRLFDRGEFLFLQGYPICGFYFQLEGQIKLVRTLQSGRETVIRHLEAPRIYGGAEFFLDLPASVSALVTVPAAFLYLPFEPWKGALSRDPDFLYFLGKNYAEITYVSNTNFPISQTASPAARVASYLLSNEKNGLFSGPLTEAPEYLGISYRHLLRILTEFVQKGYLKKEGSRYRIADREGLMETGGDRYLP